MCILKYWERSLSKQPTCLHFVKETDLLLQDGSEQGITDPQIHLSHRDEQT